MSARVKADIMISRHVGPDGRLLIVRLADPSTQVLPLIGLWTVTLGSKQSFAAAIPKVYYADLAAVCCTLHHSLVLTICDFGYDAWQAETSN